MVFKIEKHELVDTGGGCMVSFDRIWLPDENRTVYGATSYEVSGIYETEEESYNVENPVALLWFDEVENSTNPYKDLLAHLLSQFDEE